MSRGLRLSGGVWRGRRIAVPAGARPTEGRVREALMSMWQSHLSAARVLDLFAGSGAVGLECLSRGAETALLVDRSNAGLRSLKQNCRDLKAGDAAKVLRLDLPKGLSRIGASFDLIFADPPYDFSDYEALVVGARALLRPDGRLVVEHESPLPEALEPLDCRVYGGSRLSFYGRS